MVSNRFNLNYFPSIPDCSPDGSINAITLIFRAYLSEQSMEHLSGALKRGGVKDLLLYFPANKRDPKTLDEYFRKEGLPQVAEWWNKKQTALIKESVTKDLTEMIERGDSNETVIAAIKTILEETPLPESELIQCIWQGLMASVDWSTRPDQIEGLALREVTVSDVFSLNLYKFRLNYNLSLL
jgi:hypothetical protein